MEVNLTTAAVVIAVLISCSIGAMLVVRRSVSFASLRNHHDVTDPILAVVGTLFAILLGFVLANSMQRFEEARSNVQEEAGAIGDVYRLAQGLPKDGLKIQQSCLLYTDSVIDEEWPAMKAGHMDPKAWQTFEFLWNECVEMEPTTQGQTNIHAPILQSMSKAAECRRARMAQLTYGLPISLWIVVLVGAAATISLSYFFAVENLKLQIVMTSIVTLVIGLNVYMLAGFDAPYSGDIHVTSAPFKTLREIFKLEQQVQKAR